MLITAALLQKHGACAIQVQQVCELFPRGAQPTVEDLTLAASEGLDPWWLWHLLPKEGPGSWRAYALWCAEQVAYLNTDPRIAECLAVVRRKVEDPAAVSGEELRDAAWAADAAAAAAAAAARAAAAAWAAYAAADAADAAAAAARAGRDSVREAQLACLSEMLRI